MPADPRTHVTPDAFSVAPELLGYALATPLRRLVAIGIDLALAALIARTGIEILIASAAALFAWRAIGGPADRLLAGRGRLVFRAASAILVLIIVINVWNAARDKVRDLEGGDTASPAATAGDADVDAALEDLGLTARERAAFLVRFASMQMAGENAAEQGAELGRWVRDNAVPGPQRDEFAAGLAQAMKPEARTAFLQQLQAAGTVAAAAPGPAAAGTPDSAVSDSAAAAPPDSVRLLAAANAQLRERNAELRDRIDEAEKARPGGFKAWLGGISNDLGLGFGWFALYFTAFTVLGRGQTPGKRLLGIKVLRLDNRPIGWWQAFERFGGYAASFSTGLLGFAQILWDPNRQGLHDKAVETVVIRLSHGQPLKLT